MTYFDECAETPACVRLQRSCVYAHPGSPLSLQVWRGALARARCRRMRAVYAIMGCYKRYKVKAHFWEVESRFANVRNMADYGKSVEWPTPPAALSQFHSTTVLLHRR